LFKNIYYDKYNEKILLWEQIKNEDLFTEIDWIPYLWVKSGQSDWTDIYNNPVQKAEFRSYDLYKKANTNNAHYLENNVKEEIKFLVDRYGLIPDEEMTVPVLKKYFIDIEVDMPPGIKPDIKTGLNKITSITIYHDNKAYVWGCKPYTGKKKIEYHYFSEEKKMLQDFLSFMHIHPCDVISGWWISGFDLPYIIKRCETLGLNYKLLSPVKIVSVWGDNDFINIDIAGLTVLDYLPVMKYYYTEPVEQWTLKYVANKILNKTKLDYSELAIDLNDLYHNHWNTYIDYNIIDAKRVKQMEDQLKYIDLIQTMSLLCRVPMKFFNTQTQLIEGAVLTRLRRMNKCAPRLEGGQVEEFEAAYVKEPVPGMYPWVVDLDVTSEYPTMFIIMNMSPETYYGKITQVNIDNDVIVDILDSSKFEDYICNYTKKSIFPSFILNTGSKIIEMKNEKLAKFNQALTNGLISIAPNGAIFRNDKPGVLATMERELFAKRKVFKSKMKEAKKNKDNNLVKIYDAYQKAVKLVLNATYGATAVPYSRYFNINMSTAITAGGRRTIKQGEQELNRLLQHCDIELFKIINTLGKVKEGVIERDYIITADTDSLFFSLEFFIVDRVGKDAWYDLTDDKKIDIILKLSKVLEKKINSYVVENIQYGDFNSAEKDFLISFKQEVIAKNALFVAKKRYGLQVINEEGVPVDKLIIKGLETVRSDTPEIIRDKLKEVMKLLLNGATDREIKEMIDEHKNELFTAYPEEISSNVSINGLVKYISKDGPIKGAPKQVKGAYNYTKIIEELKLNDKYDEIREGQKHKIVYLKKNRYHMAEMAFISWPSEFKELGIEVDMKKMIDKNYVEKIRMLLEPIGKEKILQEKSVLEDLFF
jgi:DNA polymerase elongation subunit (family B)